MDARQMLTHLCLLVDELEPAVESFAKKLGVTFRPPGELQALTLIADEEVEETIRFTFSTTPPYLELVEGNDRGIFGRDKGYGLHHIGGFENLSALRMSGNPYEGLAVEAEVHTPDRSLHVATFFAPQQLWGARLELVEASLKSGWEDWISGETFTEAIPEVEAMVREHEARH